MKVNWRSPYLTRSGEQRTQRSRLAQAATCIGVSLDVYLDRLDAGEAWCGGHRAFEPRERFGVGRNSSTGLYPFCKAIVSARDAARRPRKPSRG